jgi:hypothetical protein
VWALLAQSRHDVVVLALGGEPPDLPELLRTVLVAAEVHAP